MHPERVNSAHLCLVYDLLRRLPFVDRPSLAPPPGAPLAADAVDPADAADALQTAEDA